MQEILQSTDSEVETVIVEPDGTWHLPVRDSIALGDSDSEEEEGEDGGLNGVGLNGVGGGPRRLVGAIDLTLDSEEESEGSEMGGTTVGTTVGTVGEPTGEPTGTVEKTGTKRPALIDLGGETVEKRVRGQW